MNESVTISSHVVLWVSGYVQSYYMNWTSDIPSACRCVGVFHLMPYITTLPYAYVWYITVYEWCMDACVHACTVCCLYVLEFMYCSACTHCNLPLIIYVLETQRYVCILRHLQNSLDNLSSVHFSLYLTLHNIMCVCTLCALFFPVCPQTISTRMLTCSSAQPRVWSASCGGRMWSCG